MLLPDSKKYKEAFKVIKIDIEYMPKEFKKNLEEENIVL